MLTLAALAGADFAQQASAAPARNGSPGLDVPVTRLISLTGETKSHDLPTIAHGTPDVFCDWVSIYQHHPQGLPLLNDGAVFKYDADGTLECMTLKKARIEGSYATSVFIRCDGSTVMFEGNVSKFGRKDNLFGFSFDQCIQRINALLVKLNLPPFTIGTPSHRQLPNGQWEKMYSGARVSRMDITQNFCAGSASRAAAFMTWLSTQQASRMKTHVYGHGETVEFGGGSRLVYTKAYLKAAELLKHAKKLKTEIDIEINGEIFKGLGSSKEIDSYVQDLSDWCDSVGLIRWESTYKSTWLIQNNQQYLGAIDMAVIFKDFEKRKEVFTRSNIDFDDMTVLPAKLLSVYRMWAAGDDITSKYSRSQFYKHRKALLGYGVDIAIRGKVTAFPIRTRVLTLSHAVPPAFYERHNHLALAA